MLHLFSGLVYILMDSVVCDPPYLISGAASFELQYDRSRRYSSQDEVWR